MRAATTWLTLTMAAGLAGCGGERPAQRTSDTAADTTVTEHAPPPAPEPGGVAQSSVTGQTYIVHGVCPFKCCHYGNWTSLRGGALRTEPNLSADSVGGISPGAQMRTDSGVMVLSPPGIAVVVGDSAGSSAGPQAGDTVEVLNYVGHGQEAKRVRWQGQEMEMTSGLRMVRDPMQQWWVYVTDPTTMTGGWMLMGGVSAGEVGALPDSCYKR